MQKDDDLQAIYLAVADDLVDRARKATTFQVSQELLKKCCPDSPAGAKR